MAYTNQDIESRARGLMASPPHGCGSRALRTVCRAAAQELEKRLRAGVKSSDIEELFVSAAGILALSMYMELYDLPESKLDSFSAGELNIKFNSGERLESAATLRRRAESMLSAYLECGGFEFRGV